MVILLGIGESSRKKMSDLSKQTLHPATQQRGMQHHENQQINLKTQKNRLSLLPTTQA